MLGNTYSHSHTGVCDDYDDDESIFGREDALFGTTGLAGSSRRNMSFDPTGGIGAYLASRDSMKLHNSKTPKDTKSRLSGKGAAAGRKSYTRGGRAYSGKTKPLKSVTSNQMHAAVFPNMRVPIYMRKQNGKKNRFRYEALGGSGRGLAMNSRGEDVPVMSVQCPMPGGTSVTVQTDPVQKVAWGPISRIEATGHAKDLVKQLRQAVKAAKKSKGKDENKGKEDEDSDAEGEEASKPVEPWKKKDSTGVEKQCDSVVIGGLTAEDGITLETSSVADTEATSDSNFNAGRRGFIRAPPATPGEEVFLRSPTSAAAMSMPTIPTMHHIADTKLVEYFRLQHVTDPEAFEKETRDIKQGLIDAKIKRGGLSFLLREEYTVELASREGAEIAEKWAKGQARCREFPGQRSRANSLNSQPSTGSLRMRGGDIEESVTASFTPRNGRLAMHPLGLPVANPAPHSSPVSVVPEGSENNEPVPHLDLSAAGSDDKTPGAKPDFKKEKKFTAKDDAKPKFSIKEIKKALSRLNIGENVTKVTTYGSVRHQSSLKREATDHGEKRTVKTWIEITEVYDVPKPQKLTVKDIAAAVRQEQEDAHGRDSDWESDETDSDGDSEPGEKEIGRKKKSKAKKFSNIVSDSSSSASSDSSDSESDSESVSDHDPVHGAGAYHDPNETSAQALLRSLHHLGEDTGDANLTRLGNDCNALIAGLGGQGLLHVGTDGQQTVGW